MVMFAEVRKNGQWHKVGKEFVSTYEEMEGQLTDRVFDGRNDYLTSALRDYSVYGILTNDVSDEVKNRIRRDAAYFCSLRNILSDINWDEEFYEVGYISEWQYVRLKKDNTKPVNIIKNPWYVGYREVSSFHMDMIIEHPSLREDKKYCVKYKYNKHVLKDQCEFFCNITVPTLIELIPEGGTIDDVRIIFSI